MRLARAAVVARSAARVAVATAAAVALAASPSRAAAAGAPVSVSVALARVDQRWRVEIAGQPIGWSRLVVTCDREACDAAWLSVFRPPEPADGVLRRRLLSRTRLDGRALSVRAEVDGAAPVEAGAGPVPASLAELLLSHAADGERLCVEVRDEATGETGPACATRRGDWLEGEVLGVALRYRAKPGAPPAEVELPAQRARFVADRRATLPARAPRLLESEVALGPGLATDAGPAEHLRFCGRPLEPEPESATAAAAESLRSRMPDRGWPEGASCREKTTRWVERARGAKVTARHVVGVAFDGAGFVWHEWAEAWVDRRWTPVDPSFRQLPARGPRFAIARFDDEPTRQAAGRAILACWGRRVERAR